MSEKKEPIEKKVKQDELAKGLNLYTGDSYILKVPSIRIHLEIDPGDSSSEDDKYTLFSTDSDAYYKKTLTVSDDKIDGNNCIDLDFPGVRADLNYSLEIDPGSAGEKYLVFEDTPYSTIAGKEFRD